MCVSSGQDIGTARSSGNYAESSIDPPKSVISAVIPVAQQAPVFVARRHVQTRIPGTRLASVSLPSRSSPPCAGDHLPYEKAVRRDDVVTVLAPDTWPTRTGQMYVAHKNGTDVRIPSPSTALPAQRWRGGKTTLGGYRYPTLRQPCRIRQQTDCDCQA